MLEERLLGLRKRDSEVRCPWAAPLRPLFVLTLLLVLVASCRSVFPVDPSRADPRAAVPTSVPSDTVRPWRALALRELNHWDYLGIPSEGGLPVHQVLAAPSTGVARVLLAVAGKQVYRSTDAGSNWEQWPLSLGPLPPDAKLELSFSSSPGSLRTLFASVSGHVAAEVRGVYRSDDGGVRWEHVLVGPVRHLAVSPTFHLDQALLALGAGREASAWVSHDRGGSWAALPPAEQVWFSPEYARDRILFAVVAGRLLQWREEAGAWVSALDAGRVRGLTFSPFYRVDGLAFVYGDGLYRGVKGANWVPIGLDLDDDDTVETVAVGPSSVVLRSMLAVVARRDEDGLRYQMLRSGNDGRSWHRTTGEWAADELPGAPTFSQTTLGRVYLPTTRGLWESEDGGDTWTNLTPQTAIDGPGRVRSLALATSRTSTVEACFLATDKGLWRLVRPVRHWSNDEE